MDRLVAAALIAAAAAYLVRYALRAWRGTVGGCHCGEGNCARKS